jgi:hypothetical protein
MNLLARKDVLVRIAIGVVVALSLLSAGRFLRRPAEETRPLGITVSQYEKRFAPLRRVLPDHGVIGYLGADSKYWVPNYYATQYVLAPLVVDNSPEHDLVVGNFDAGSEPAWPSNLVLMHDFGNGVVLLAKRRD